MLSEEAKRRIDEMSIADMHYEVARGRQSRFQGDKFAYLEARLAEIQSETRGSAEMPTWKEKFENTPVIFGITLVIFGFGMGYGVSEWTQSFRENAPSVAASIAKIENQIEELTKKHNVRLDALHKSLEENEKEAVYGGHLDSRQEKHIRAAERIRKSIAEENESYRMHLEQLMKIAASHD